MVQAGGMDGVGTEGRQVVELGSGSAVCLTGASTITLAATFLGKSDALGLFVCSESHFLRKSGSTTFFLLVNSKGKGKSILLCLP